MIQDSRNKRTILIYLSGKITGLADLNIPKFEAAEKLIIDKQEYKDVFVYVFNPHNLPDDHDKRWGSYMRECARALCSSHKIYVLDDWKKSKGALTEVLLAKVFNMPLYSVETMERMEVSFNYLLWKLFLKFLKHNDQD